MTNIPTVIAVPARDMTGAIYPRKLRAPEIESFFWQRVAKGEPGACWWWRGSTRKGYGKFQFGLRLYAAHRFSWQLANGRAVPEGMYVCHSCDNPLCVNPGHLWIGSHSDNIRDCSTKGRHPETKVTHCPRGHAYDAENTYVTRPGTRVCRECRRASVRRWKQR